MVFLYLQIGVLHSTLSLPLEDEERLADSMPERRLIEIRRLEERRGPFSLPWRKEEE
jgi:hypothetical protein